jgi:protein Tex
MESFPLTNDEAALFRMAAESLQLSESQVRQTVELLDDGNTVPFITRYRKEQTGGLDEEQIRSVQRFITEQRELREQRGKVIKAIEEQGKLTDHLRAEIESAPTLKRLDELYAPFRSRRKTRADEAREMGLGPLAEAIWTGRLSQADLETVAANCVGKHPALTTPEIVLQGAADILAARIAERVDVRDIVRSTAWKTGRLTAQLVKKTPDQQASKKKKKKARQEAHKFQDFDNYSQPLGKVPPHRILALDRGEDRKFLRVGGEWDQDLAVLRVCSLLQLKDHRAQPFLKECVIEALKRLVNPSIEREVRRDLTERAHAHAIKVFSRNLRNLLLQPPLHRSRVLAIDPGYRTGCKIVLLNEDGRLLADDVVQLTQEEALPEMRRKLAGLVRRLSGMEEGQMDRGDEGLGGEQSPMTNPQSSMPNTDAEDLSSETEDLSLTETSPSSPLCPSAPVPTSPLVIAIGNGTACRETEAFVAETIAEQGLDCKYVIVNESGASIYSASDVGRQEFPDLDATVRGTVSIGRRLQDPLSELVKIEPQHIGVGMYQHDLPEKKLRLSLDAVVESCVNHVGVNLNRASAELLRYVSGLNRSIAKKIVGWRNEHGPFRNRADLLNVPGVGEMTFTQAAGFLKLSDGDEPLDATWIHPESYDAARTLMSRFEIESTQLRSGAISAEHRSQIEAVNPEQLSRELQTDPYTMRHLLESLTRPGRDPREDLPGPLFRSGILTFSDLQPGMQLSGVVTNVVDFGAFIDIGLKNDGLVHVSRMADKYVTSPYDRLSVGDVVTVWVDHLDTDRQRLALTMCQPEE